MRKSRAFATALAVGLAATIFVLDLMLPLGVAGGVPYLAVVLVSLWSPRRVDIVLAGVLGSLLTLLGFVWSSPGGVLWMVLSNRALALFAIWTTVLVGWTRRQAEERLGDSEERLRLMTDALPVLIAYVDADERYRFVNAPHGVWFGRDSGALIGSHLREILGDDSYEVAHAHAQTALAGRPCAFEHRLCDVRGRERSVLIDYVPHRRHDGEVVGFFSLIRDVTEREEVEEALRESTATTRSILAAAVDGIITIDEKGIIQSLNPAAERIFGYDAERLHGRNVSMLMPAPYREEHDGYISRYLATGERRIIGIGREVEGKRADGTVFPIDLAVTEILTPTGRSFVGTVRDITGRRETEEALRRERDLADNLVETAPAIVLVLDGGGRIVRFNRYMEKLTGYRLEEVRGRSWFDTFVPKVERERINSVFERTLEEQLTHGTINSVLTKEGRERVIEWYNATLRDADGEITGVLAIGLDITERLELEGQFRQAQKMEAVGQLAGGVAHDFNTLLGSIIGYSELLLDQLPEADPSRRPVERIHRSADRGAALTRQLLAFSRQQVLQPKVVGLSSVVAGMEDMIRRLIAEHVELVFHAEPGAVRVDPGQMEQVIMNLVVNARDAMPRGGRVTITTEQLELEQPRLIGGVEVPAGSYMVLRVADTGCGIDEETHARLFEPFYTTKDPGKGTGLGLSTVYGIVKQSQGEITVETESGSGTCFSIYLPLLDAVPSPVADIRPAPAMPAAGQGETVLVVEDDPTFRELICEVLEGSGFRVMNAGDAQQAFDVAGGYDGTIDLLISDVGIPEMPGTELARQLSTARPEMKLLLMSGYSDAILGERGAAAPGLPILRKPFAPRDLLARVREVLTAP